MFPDSLSGPKALVLCSCTSRLMASIVEKIMEGGAKSIGLDGQGCGRLDTRRSESHWISRDHNCGVSRKAGHQVAVGWASGTNHVPARICKMSGAKGPEPLSSHLVSFYQSLSGNESKWLASFGSNSKLPPPLSPRSRGSRSKSGVLFLIVSSLSLSLSQSSWRRTGRAGWQGLVW